MVTDLRRQANQFDLFYYTADEGKCENLVHYKLGGLHPISLGDVLPKPSTCISDIQREPRYRILLKLGFGASATVWLARDMVERRLVAIKVGKGWRSPSISREASILHELRSIKEPGCERIIQLFDSFTIRGPNGFHECLVLEVIAPIVDVEIDPRLSPVVIEQVLQGFAFLHNRGIVHGDPHLANIGISLPTLEHFEDDDLFEHFSNPDLLPVIPRDPSMASPSLPSYLVLPDSLVNFLHFKGAFPEPSEIYIKIIDFGRSYRTREMMPPLPGGAPLYVRPPEAVIHEQSKGRLGSVWSKEADIWAIGSTIYSIDCGSEFLSTWGSTNDYLLQSVQYGGPAPEEWADFLSDCGQRSTNDSSDREMAWRGREKIWLRQGVSKAALFALLKEMIVTDPAKRLPMQKLLDHPYFGTHHKKYSD